MDVQMDIREPATPAPFDDVSYWRTDDSGYHTSFTPGSMECSEISNETLNPSVGKRLKREQQVSHDVKDTVTEYHKTPHRRSRRLRSAAVTPVSLPDSPLETPTIRRGTKRPYQEDLYVSGASFTSVPTPTSLIAGGITKLKVNDSLDAARFSQSPLKSVSNVATLDSCEYSSYPVTPVKKICRSNTSICNDSHSSPLQSKGNICCRQWRSPNKHSLVCHTLDGEMQPVNQSKPQSKDVRPSFRPDQKIDIIGMLYTTVSCVPAIQNILDYLSQKDMHTFSSVSLLWKQISDEMPKAMKMKKEYQDFMTNTKENSENRLSKRKTVISPKEGNYKVQEFLKDNSNLANLRSGRKCLARSPRHSPRTRKFKTFVKSASLDSARVQLPCVRCSQPAIVYEETSGEQWLECISVSCSYKFCRYCKCERHPNKKCFAYDLDGCSPKRKLKSSSSAAGTKKSKKNLRRLLDFN